MSHQSILSIPEHILVYSPKLVSPLARVTYLQFQHRSATNTSLGTTPGAASQLRRRRVTVFGDDGSASWGSLSSSEKAARTTQQSFNFLLVGAGAVATVAVSYLLYTELFAADSKTRQFNAAVDRIKASPECTALLGLKNKIKAYGEPTSNKWARARPLAHKTEVDKFGVTHFRMHFHVEGPDGEGIVNVHMTKTKEESELQYNVLSLNVKGHPLVYLENREAKGPAKVARKMFGMKWG